MVIARSGGALSLTITVVVPPSVTVWGGGVVEHGDGGVVVVDDGDGGGGACVHAVWEVAEAEVDGLAVVVDGVVDGAEGEGGFGVGRAEGDLERVRDGVVAAGGAVRSPVGEPNGHRGARSGAELDSHSGSAALGDGVTRRVIEL